MTCLPQVALLFDRTNDWIAGHFDDFAPPGYVVTRHFDHRDLDARDIVIVLSYTRILDRAFLDRNGLTVVVHESDLPKGRGFAPVQWQILAGATTIPICLLEAGDAVDSGDIFVRDTFEVPETALYPEIRARQAQATRRIVERFLAIYPDVSREKQTGDPTIYPRRRPADAELDVDRTIAEQFDLMRIANNDGWPSFFFIRGKKYVVRISEDGESSQ